MFDITTADVRAGYRMFVTVADELREVAEEN